MWRRKLSQDEVKKADKIDDLAEELFAEDPVNALSVMQRITRRMEEWFGR